MKALRVRVSRVGERVEQQEVEVGQAKEGPTEGKSQEVSTQSNVTGSLSSITSHLTTFKHLGSKI